MTKININNNFSHYANINGISNVSYYRTGAKTYSAISIEEIYGVFVSNILVAPSQFIRWSSIEIDCTNRKNTWIYIRNTSNEDIETAEWQGPFKNTSNKFESLKGNYLQIMVVFKGDNEVVPNIKALKANFISSQGSSLFFTKTFNLGFRAKHVVVSYNAEKSVDAILRFAITGEDTIDPSKYQYIEPNKIQELYGIPLFSDKIKLMMEIAGDSGVPISVNEIAMMFSGDKTTNINQDEIMSSLSSFSESSSTSSSSSIDSTSSSSIEDGIGFDKIAITFEVG